MKTAILYMIRPLELNERYARQEMIMEAYSKEHNIQIIKKFSDIGDTKTNLKRPALNEMVKFLVHANVNIDTALFYGMEHHEKDMKRVQYIMQTMKKYIPEFLFIKDVLLEEKVERETS